MVESMGVPLRVAGWKVQWARTQRRAAESRSGWPEETVTSAAVGRPVAETRIRSPTEPEMRRSRREAG